jgi:ADP-ribose pyrophosphatase YjhB (NUDIX family)
MYKDKYFKYKKKYLDFKMKGGDLKVVPQYFFETKDMAKKQFELEDELKKLDIDINNLKVDNFALHFVIAKTDDFDKINKIIEIIKNNNAIPKQKKRESLHIYYNLKNKDLQAAFLLFEQERKKNKDTKFKLRSVYTLPNSDINDDYWYADFYTWFGDPKHDKVQHPATNKGGAGAFIVMKNDQDGKDYVLCILEDREDSFHGIYKSVGGAVDLKENYVDALLRELKEEVSIDITADEVEPILISGYTKRGDDKILYNDCFLTLSIRITSKKMDAISAQIKTYVEEDETQNHDGEVVDFIWLDITKIKADKEIILAAAKKKELYDGQNLKTHYIISSDYYIKGTDKTQPTINVYEDIINFCCKDEPGLKMEREIKEENGKKKIKNK